MRLKWVIQLKRRYIFLPYPPVWTCPETEFVMTTNSRKTIEVCNSEVILILVDTMSNTNNTKLDTFLWGENWIRYELSYIFDLYLLLCSKKSHFFEDKFQVLRFDHLIKTPIEVVGLWTECIAHKVDKICSYLDTIRTQTLSW